VARGWVHDQTRRFVNHHDVRVFVKDGQRDGFGQKTGRTRGRNAAGDGVPGLQTVARFLGPVVDPNVAARDELGRERACSTEPATTEKDVQPLTRRGRIHKDGKGVAVGHGR